MTLLKTFYACLCISLFMNPSLCHPSSLKDNREESSKPCSKTDEGNNQTSGNEPVPQPQQKASDCEDKNTKGNPPIYPSPLDGKTNEDKNKGVAGNKNPDLIKNILYLLNQTGLGLQDIVFGSIGGVLGPENKDLATKIFGEGPLQNTVAEVLSRNGLLNAAIIDRGILYPFFGGERPENYTGKTLNPGDNVFSQLAGNDYSVVDKNGDVLFTNLAGRGPKESANKKLD